MEHAINPMPELATLLKQLRPQVPHFERDFGLVSETKALNFL
jgi:hypothetical protein